MDKAPRLRVTGVAVGMNAWAAAKKEMARTEITRIVLVEEMWGGLCGVWLKREVRRPVKPYQKTEAGMA